jgi:hypothetical protein
MEIQVGKPESKVCVETERLRTPFFWDIVLRYWVFFTQRVLLFKNSGPIYSAETLDRVLEIYKGADKSLARPTSRCIFLMVRIFLLMLVLFYIYIYI